MPGLRSCGSRALEQETQKLWHTGCCSATCGAFPDKGSNPCLLHPEAYSSPLSHQRSPELSLVASEERGGGVCETVVPFFIFWIQDPVRSHVWLICLFLLLKSNIELHPSSSPPTHTLKNFFFKDVNFLKSPTLFALEDKLHYEFPHSDI